MINNSDARNIIRRTVGKSWLWLLEPEIYLSDRNIPEYHPDAVAKVLRGFTPSRAHTDDEFDCEDERKERLGFLTREGFRGVGYARNRNHDFDLFFYDRELWVKDENILGKYSEVIKFDPENYSLRGYLKYRDLIVI